MLMHRQTTHLDAAPGREVTGSGILSSDGFSQAAWLCAEELSEASSRRAHPVASESWRTAPQRWQSFCAAPFGSGTFLACDTCTAAQRCCNKSIPAVTRRLLRDNSLDGMHSVVTVVWGGGRGGGG